MKEIKQLLSITSALKLKYGKNFTLDGKLVGDIGEVLCAEKYGLELLDENAPIHDAIENATGRMVQIKSSFKNYSYFPGEGKEIPDYFLSVNIDNEGKLEELFNGPGQFIVEHYIKGRNLKLGQKEYSLDKSVLIELGKDVPEDQKIMIVK